MRQRAAVAAVIFVVALVALMVAGAAIGVAVRIFKMVAGV